MLTEPQGQRLGFPIPEEIDVSAPLQIDQDGTVATTLPKRPVTGTKDAGSRPCGYVGAAQQAEQRRSASG
jgi:hypothetical protein